MLPTVKAKYISQCLELAVLLESSASKPGNVNRTAGFEGTRFEHFLASAVALRSSFEKAAERGMAILDTKISVKEAEIGSIIKQCVTDINSWQHGGNTLLGTSILLSPVAVAAGMTSLEDGSIDVRKLRGSLKLVVESTMSEDAVDVYEAIRAAKPGGLGASSQFDVNDPRSIERIRREKMSLYQIFKTASSYDLICSEWVNNYPITFDVAYPTLTEQIERERDLNTAIIHTFLKILGEYPDTFIARKTGMEKAREVSREAKEILSLGGLATVEGKKRLDRFDRQLRKQSNLLNPGTTADIVCAALALCVLDGYRP